MFNLFKKNNEGIKKQNEVKPSEDEIKKIEKDIKELTIRIEDYENVGASKAIIYEDLGLKHAYLGNDDDAIECLEKSLDEKISIGEGFKKLMSLYNMKRKEAAISKDSEKIEIYMKKMDDMRQIAKKGTIKR